MAKLSKFKSESLDIERIAVDAVSEYFTWTTRLRIEPSVNDKTPFTDGHIDLYGSRIAKEDYVGRARIQIKGKLHRKQFKNEESFSITLLDARGLQKLRGVFFFLVMINPKTRERAVYGRVLTPLFLKNLIDSFGDQHKRAIHFPRLPSSEDSLISAVQFALKAQEETAPVALNPKLLDLGVTLTLYSPTEIDFARPVTLDRDGPDVQDFSIFVRTAEGLTGSLGGSFSLVPPNYMDHPLPFSLSAGHTHFEKPTGRKLDEHTLHISPSPSISVNLTLREGIMSGAVSLREAGTFAEYMDAATFLLAADEHQSFRIGSRDVPFRIDSSDALDDLRGRLEELCHFRDLFTTLDVDESAFSILDFDERSIRELNTLHRALVLDEHIPATRADSGRIDVQFCGWAVELMCTYYEEDGSWKVENPFSAHWERIVATSTAATEGQESFHLITPYDWLDAERYPKLLNLSLKNIVHRYEALPDGPKRYEFANATTLKLISAADASPARRNEFLDAASLLNTWLLENEPGSTIHRINGWQISARKGELSEQDREHIFDLMNTETDSAWSSTVVRLSCAILLGDTFAISRWKHRLTLDERLTIEAWPIMRLAE